MPDITDRLNAALEGRYIVEGEVGEGGMANVYLATDLKHGRKVALKVLKPDLAASLGADRFLTEIRTTASLQHPHILPLFDSGEAGGFLFYVMPYVEGETLKERIERDKQLPVDEAVAIATAVANALHAAHAKGIIHRDIKPANILMSAGEPLVSDFGIAVAIGAAGGARVTEAGLSVGTPFYMSPEQATGDQKVGPPSDIYALACVLYELLVGEPPYTGSTAQAVLGKILTGAPVSSTGERSSIPIHVDAAIRRALEKVPADRFTGAHDFARALANPSFRHGEWKMGSRRAGEEKWKRVAQIASASAAGFALLAVWAVLDPPPPQPVERFVVPANAIGTPALFPDGSGMVYVAPADDGRIMLWARRWESLDATPVPGTTGRLRGTPTMSPDGTQVVYHDRGDLKVAALTGGTVRTLTDDAECCTRWGSDGHLYYSAAGVRNIRRVPAAGGTSEEVTPSTGMTGSEGEFHLMPDGDTGLFSVWGNPPRLDAIRISTGERATVAMGLKSFVDPDRIVIHATMEGNLMASRFNSRRMELSIEPVPVAQNIFISLRNYPFFTVSESGTLAYVTGGDLSDPQPVWVDRTGSPVAIDATLTYDPAGNGPLALSGDGSQLAMSIVDGERTDIWVMDVERDQAPRRRITFEGLTNDRPTWLPGGESLVYLSRAPGQRSFWSRRADGSQDPQLVLDDTTYRLLGGEVTRDGAWLVYRRGQEPQELDAATGASDLFAVSLTGNSQPQAVVASEFDERAPAVSPDSRWIAYVSDQSGQDEVFVRPFPESTAGLTQVSIAGGTEPAWSADGTEMFYRNANGEMVAVSIQAGADFNVVEQTVLFDASVFQSSPLTRSYQVHPDGQRFVMMQRADLGGNVVLVRNWMEEVRSRIR